MKKIIKNILRPIVRIVRKPQPHMYLQEYLFRKALLEIGIEPKTPVTIDHLRGRNSVYGIELGIKYPREYLTNATAIPVARKYSYVFLGNMDAEGGRKEMLAPFMKADSLIEEDNYGRNAKTKYSFNVMYYTALRSSRFSLCPHQLNWQGPREAMWTYRFIESVFSETLPIVFRRAPCSEMFLDGFCYFWDDENINLEGYEAKISANRLLAEKRFFFVDEEITRLRAAHEQATSLNHKP